MGQHRHHTTRSAPQIPTWPPAHSPLPTGEIRGYNIAYGMLVKVINQNTSRGQGVTGDRCSERRLCKTREPMNKNLIQPERCGDSLPESCKMQAMPTRWGELAQHSEARW